MQKYVTLALTLLASLCCWGQYTTTYKWTKGDLTSYAISGTNAWKSIVGSSPCKVASPAAGYDRSVWCVRADGYVYDYSIITHAWTKHANMGTAVIGLAVQNAGNIYSWQLASSCGSAGGFQFYALFHWNGTAWNPTATGCGTVYAVGADGTLRTIGWNTTSQKREVENSTDNGNTWSSIGVGFEYVSIYDQTVSCAISTSGQLFLWDGSTSAYIQAGTQPSGTSVGCLDTPGFGPNRNIATNHALVATWDTSSAFHIFSASNGTWGNVAGLAVKSVVGSRKGRIIALDASGNPYHWNVHAPQVTGTNTGSWNNCPSPGNPCPNGGTHTGSIGLGFSDHQGVNNYNVASQTIPTNGQMNLSGWDSNPQCDPNFGNPNDPACLLGPPSGGDLCNVSHQNLETPSQPPALPTEGTSHDYQSQLIVDQYGPQLIGRDWIGYDVATTTDACIASIATCPHYAVDALFVNPSQKAVEYLMENFWRQSPWLIEVPYVTSPELGTECFYEDEDTIPTFGSVVGGMCD